tara:strand:- start:1490 stop:2752 length:1263 start_codon:yes stop_codon:yes gene_type:complete
MAKVKKEEVVEKTTDEKVEAPMGDKIKVKDKPKRMKNLGELKDDVIKVDLSKPAETNKKDTTEQTVDEQPKDKQPEEKKDDKVVEEVQEKVEDKKVEEKKEEETEQPVLEEVTNEKTDENVKQEAEAVEEAVEEAVTKSEKTGKELPENIQKVVDFMNETGGDLEDYVKLNQDYSKLDNMSLLREYYTQTKPHLNSEEISFLIEDSFSYDEDADETIDVKRKKLAFKEQVANAKTHLDGLKSKYYAEIKSGVKLTPDQQKAIDFFNRYNKENKESQEVVKQQQSIFQEKTNNVFNDKFKGFEYNVGEKKFRFNVKDVSNVKDTQSDINNFVSKFLDKRNNTMNDATGYHKSLFTAMNADTIANHFYEQGKADGVKESISKTKNLDMTPRQNHETVHTSGIKARVISGDDSNKLRFKLKNY